MPRYDLGDLRGETTVELSALRAPSEMRAAYAGLLLYFLLYFGRPEDWIPGVASIPLSLLSGAVALLGCIGGLIAAGKPLRLPSEMILIVLLLCDFYLATGFSLWPSGSLQVIWVLTRPVLVALVVFVGCTTVTRLRRLIWVHTLCITVISIVSSWNYRHGRMSAVVGGPFGNPNELAFSICLVLPFCLAFLLLRRHLYQKIFWIIVTGSVLYGVMLTYSRGGLIVLATIMMAMIWNFSIGSKRRAVLFLVPVLLVGFAVYAPSGYMDRMATIANPEEKGSAAERKELFETSLRETIEHPFLGVGPATFELVSGRWLGTHNTYTQLSSEAGIPALLLFLWILKRAFSNLWYAKKSTDDEIRLLANAIQASMLGILVGFWFLHAAYQAYVYFLIAYTSALYSLARNLETKPAPGPAFVSVASVVPRWPSLAPTYSYVSHKEDRTKWRT